MDGKLRSYQTAETLGKSQLDLILQVYDGAIGYYRTARDHYAANRLNEGYEQIEKARRCMVHLYTTLDMEAGGEIANNLSRLYSYIISQTDVAQASKDLNRIDDNIKILENLRQSWSALKEQDLIIPAESEPVAAGSGNNTGGFSTSA